MIPATERDRIVAIMDRLNNLYECRDIADKNWLELEEKYLKMLKEAIEERLGTKNMEGF